MSRPATLIDSLRGHTEHAPDAFAMSWQPELARQDAERLSRAALWQAAQYIASGLNRLEGPAGRPRMAILAFPPGLDFIRAFLGCFMAGVIAVPVALPRRGRSAHVLEAIIANCGAGLALTSASEKTRLQELFADSPTLGTVQLISVDTWQTLPEAGAVLAGPSPDDLAFIQYTSGSTSRPKGVCVSHANLMANLALIKQSFGITPDHLMVNWLPHYHDMGLIGSLLMPIDCGIPTVSMAPSAFIKRPLRWLQTITAQDPDRWVISGGPNFAYQRCVDRVTAEDCAALSLAHWKTAFNGAEPIRAATITAFIERFAPAGFSKPHFLTCYGLAETTLFATGGHDPALMTISGTRLETGRLEPAGKSDGSARQLVSSGPADETRIAIVDPITCEKLPFGEIGEIWVTGASVPQRYLNDPQQSVQTFEARVAGDNSGTRYLATGDIGAIVDRQLYVTGRSKELLIINGRNLYPHDIEALLLSADARIGSVAVFGWNDPAATAETIVAVCELTRTARHLLPAKQDEAPSHELDRIASAMKIAAATAELSIAHLRFVGPMGIATTTSGKTGYGQLRREFGELPAGIRSAPLSADVCSTENQSDQGKEKNHEPPNAHAAVVR